jgi:hypothetical protein
VAEDADVAVTAAPVALEDLGRGRLAGAVGAEQAEDLALADLEAHVGDGDVVPVALAEVLDVDRSHGIELAEALARPVVVCVTDRA